MYTNNHFIVDQQEKLTRDRNGNLKKFSTLLQRIYFKIVFFENLKEDKLVF